MNKTDRRDDRERKRRLENREAILHAAEAVIMKNGFSATSMDDVAAEAAFSKATLYRYFKSKSELMLDIMVHFLDDLELRLKEIRSAADRSVRERLQDSVAYILEYMGDKECLSRVFLADPGFHKFVPLFFDQVDPSSPVPDCGFIERIRTHGDSITKGWEDLLAEGVAGGEFRPLDVRAAALYVAAVIEGVFAERFWSSDKPGLENDVSQITDFLCQGFMARSAGRGDER
ncbi:MAG: TetR/AcrR family transcriptional regulator [Acidobacteriota bacterium]|nr:TetR/AcrR family transcriptional regulator [Acidobacteriota bacterium]